MKRNELIEFITKKVMHYGHIRFSPPCCGHFYSVYVETWYNQDTEEEEEIVFALTEENELGLECLTIKELRQMAERIRSGN